MLVSLLLHALAAGPSGPGLGGGPSADEDPFEPGLRWSYAADPAEPWIPRDVAVLGGGELAWAAPAVGTPALVLLALSETEDPEPLFRDPSPEAAVGVLSVSAGDEASELFAVAQYPAPTSASRRSVVTRHDAEAAAAGAPFRAVWSHDFGITVNGPALVASNVAGSALVAGVFDAPSGEVHVHRLDPATGLPLFRRTLPGDALRRIAVSAAGDRVAVLAGARLHVLDGAGNSAFSRILTGATSALDLAEDGSVLAFGEAGGVEVHVAAGGGYVPGFVLPGGSDELAVEVALTRAGERLAVSWWNYATGVDLRCELVDTSDETRLLSYSQTGDPGGVQNFPSALRMTPDGRRLALGLWGVADAQPEVVLLEPGRSLPVLAVDAPGSVLALDLSADGTRLVACEKDAHANHFATTGRVGAYDTGERDLQLVRRTRPGGAAELEFRMPEPGSAIFAVGVPRPAPVRLGTVQGDFWIDLARPAFFHAGVVDACDVARVSIPIPPGTTLVGVPLAAQAASLGASGVLLAETLVRPIVL